MVFYEKYFFAKGKKTMKTFHVNNVFFNRPKQFGETIVYQIGLLETNDSVPCETHKHKNFFELTAVVDGKARVYANGQATELKSNDVFVSFPLDEHKIETASSQTLKHLFIAFDTTDTQFRAQLDKINRDFHASDRRKITSEYIVSALSRAVYESTSAEPFSAECCQALLEEIIIQLIRSYYPTTSKMRIPDHNEKFAYSVMTYIREHVRTMTTLTELCDVFGYEYSHISKIFSKTTSFSLGGYFRFQRLETARTLLIEGKTVTEVANALNYASIYSFSNAFKKQYGVSPSLYLESRLNE